MDFRRLLFSVDYYAPQLKGAVSYQNSFQEIWLNPRKKVIVERRHVVQDKEIASDDIDRYRALIEGEEYQGQTPGAPPDPGPLEMDRGLEEKTPALEDIYQMEQIPCGLQDYY